MRLKLLFVMGIILITISILSYSQYNSTKDKLKQIQIETNMLILNKNKEIQNLTNQLNQTNMVTTNQTNQTQLTVNCAETICPVCETCDICPNGTDVKDTEEYKSMQQRYTIRIKELEYYVSKVNNTDAYDSLLRNLTNCEHKRDRFNKTITNITKILEEMGEY